MQKNRYLIVLKTSMSENEKFAVSELTFFLCKIGCVQKLSQDKSFDSKDFTCVFFVGDCGNLATKSSILNTEDEIFSSDDGYEIFIEGNIFNIRGKTDYGTIYGVYGLLEILFGLKIFTDTDFCFERIEPKFPEKNYIICEPDIKVRTVGIYPVYYQNMLYTRRMRLYSFDEKWGIWSHSYFIILPPDKYAEMHPEWYTEDRKALCFTNDELKQEFAKNLIEYIKSTPDCKYYMIGQEDNRSLCHCSACQKFLEENGESVSALMMDFTIDVVNLVNNYFDSQNSERQIMFFTFAYMLTCYPPVFKDALGHFVSLLRNKLVPDNLSVLVAPNGATSSFSYFDEKNKSCFAPNYNSDKAFATKEIFEGWSKVCKSLSIWSYSADFCDFLAPFPMWNGFDENFRKYKEYNVFYIFEEGIYPYKITNFNELKIYIASRLMWDSSLDIKVLIEDFIKNYYGADYQNVLYVFNATNEYWERVKEKTGRHAFYGSYLDFESLNSAIYWSLSFLSEMIEKFDEVANNYPDDFNMLNEYQWRVLGESCPFIYLLLYNYFDKLNKEKICNYINRIKKCAEHYKMETLGEFAPHTLSYYISEWEERLKNQFDI